MIHRMLAIWPLVPLHNLNPACTSGSSQFTSYWTDFIFILFQLSGFVVWSSSAYGNCFPVTRLGNAYLRECCSCFNVWLYLPDAFCGYNFLGLEPWCHFSYDCQFEKTHPVLCVELLMNARRVWFCLPTTHVTEGVPTGTWPLVWSHFSTHITSRGHILHMNSCWTTVMMVHGWSPSQDNVHPQQPTSHLPVKDNCQLQLCSP